MKNSRILLIAASLLSAMSAAAFADDGDKYQVKVSGPGGETTHICALDQLCDIVNVRQQAYVASMDVENRKVNPKTFEHGLRINIGLSEGPRPVISLSYTALEELERVHSGDHWTERPLLHKSSSLQSLSFDYPYEIGPYTVVVTEMGESVRAAYEKIAAASEMKAEHKRSSN